RGTWWNASLPRRWSLCNPSQTFERVLSNLLNHRHHFFDVLVQPDLLVNNFAVGIQYRDDIGMGELPARTRLVFHSHPLGQLRNAASLNGWPASVVQVESS